MSSSPLDELKSLSQARKYLMQCQSVDEVIQKALKLVRDKLNSQVASLFLFSKDGVIKRVGINGIDRDGNSIDNSWFSDEQYAPGASFSGKTIPTFETESGFGEPQWSNELLKDFPMDDDTRNPYLEKLGNLKCGISVPLNGRYRTFGTLEVLNKLDNNKFSYNDIYWLTLISINVANFISDDRRRQEVNGFTLINKKLIDLGVISRHFVLQEIYDLVVEQITKKYTPYKACILRVSNNNGDLELKAKSGDVSWSNVRNSIKEAASGIVVEVFKTRNPVFINKIDSNIERFYNQKLIEQNNFKSYACIPLLVRGRVFGTISVFIGYYHKFSTNHEYFLNNIASLTAAIIARVRLLQEFKQVSQERDEARDQIFSAFRFARGDYFLQGVLHQYKNDLIDFNQVLKTISDSHNTVKIEQIINKKANYIQDKIIKIQSEFVPDIDTVIEINEIIKQVLKCFSGLKEIKILSKLNSEIPPIEINESKIKDIIFNLISNSIKAIEKANNLKGGLIRVSTDIKTLKNIQYIQIIVEDNGIGIRSELREKIFERGFTTSKEEGGTGMGLFVAKEIISDYGGQIKLESTLGKKTLFIVRIPLKRYLVS